MKNIKIIVSLFCLMAIANITFAQSAKMKEKAAAKVEKLNTQITSINPAAALTSEQVEKITNMEIEKMKGIKEIKKGEGTDEEKKAKRKELNKATSKEINKTVLTKEQRQAKKEARAKAKAAKG